LTAASHAIDTTGLLRPTYRDGGQHPASRRSPRRWRWRGETGAKSLALW